MQSISEIIKDFEKRELYNLYIEKRRLFKIYQLSGHCTWKGSFNEYCRAHKLFLSIVSLP